MYETEEPTVVDEVMLQQAVEEQGPQGQAGLIAKEEGIELKDVLHLRLDYRQILKIDHLWQFTSLTKLQLDNNIIEKITGLDCLVNLVWLDLSFNHIEKIEGLDALVIYLRKFTNLRALNLAGNSLATEECYQEEKALAKYQYALEKLIHDETLALKAIETERLKEEEIQKHRLFDSMFSEDPEAEKLSYLPGAVEDNQQVAAQMIVNFEKTRKVVLLEMQRMTDRQQLLSQIEQSSKETKQLHDDLMTLELQLADQLEEVVKDFERNISDMVASFCRDLENNHNEKLLEIGMLALEKAAKNELEEDAPDDLRVLLVDKDTVVNAVSASHDLHLLKIDNREDALVTRINSWVAALMKEIHHEEVARNRKRIAEIHNYIDYVKDQLEDMSPS
ncbi:hypothetical protein JZ751_006316 [Albula glossodonta]|uniref:Dynein regulatory complex subunit 3 n=1 Tax=Albula glossodonta TaxID=121402 RepID=A0A8T2N397_9TELE|nr:hypothetical protein JZ751_006316 [Albula glossodonta]